MKYKKKMIELLKKEEAIKFGDFTLSSGKKSDYYIDIKKASTSPEFLELYGNVVKEKIGEGIKLAGVALGGIPLVVTASIYSKNPYIMIRKQKKSYGTKERIEGILKQNQEIIMIEDVTTTGKSLINAIEVIRKLQGKVNKAIVVVDRDQGAKKRLREHKVELISLLDADDILSQKEVEEN